MSNLSLISVQERRKEGRREGEEEGGKERGRKGGRRKEGREKEGGAEGEEFLMVSKKSWLPNNELPLSLVQQPHDFTKRPTWTIWRGPTSHLQLPSKSGLLGVQVWHEGKHFRAEHKADSEGGAFWEVRRRGGQRESLGALRSQEPSGNSEPSNAWQGSPEVN